MTLILITAGEPSGDRLGAALMAALKKKRKGLRFIGVGGAEMAGQGLTSAFPMSDLAVMGLAEVLPALPRILSRLTQLTRLAVSEKPDLVITVDAQDFSARLAKKLKAALGEQAPPHLQFVAPKVWAWRPHRVVGLKKLFTHLLTILPFEVEFFKNAGLPATYVGHPATTLLAPFTSPAVAHTLALLPGSRKAEIKRHWPTMLATYRRLRALHPQLNATLALPNEAALRLCRHTAPWHLSENIIAVFGDSRFAALSTCRAALAKSGTVNLELALLGIPTVVIYKMHPITWWLAQKLVKVPFVSLPNLILGKVVFPEFLQNAAVPEVLTRALHPLLSDAKTQTRVRTQLAELAKKMKTPQPPADLAATVALSLLPPAKR